MNIDPLKVAQVNIGLGPGEHGGIQSQALRGHGCVGGTPAGSIAFRGNVPGDVADSQKIGKHARLPSDLLPRLPVKPRLRIVIRVIVEPRLCILLREHHHLPGVSGAHALGCYS